MLTDKQRESLQVLITEERNMNREIRKQMSLGRVMVGLQMIPTLVAKQQDLDTFIEKEL